MKPIDCDEMLEQIIRQTYAACHSGASPTEAELDELFLSVQGFMDQAIYDMESNIHPRIHRMMEAWDYTFEQAGRAVQWELDNNAEWSGDWMDPDNIPD